MFEQMRGQATDAKTDLQDVRRCEFRFCKIVDREPSIDLRLP